MLFTVRRSTEASFGKRLCKALCAPEFGLPLQKKITLFDQHLHSIKYSWYKFLIEENLPTESEILNKILELRLHAMMQTKNAKFIAYISGQRVLL